MSNDKSLDAAMRDRDAYHEWADNLAYAIAVHFNVDIGEHSNQNLPWAEALKVIENAERVNASTARDLVLEECARFCESKIGWTYEPEHFAEEFRALKGQYAIGPLTDERIEELVPWKSGPTDPYDVYFNRVDFARAIEREVAASSNSPEIEGIAQPSGNSGEFKNKQVVEKIEELKQAQYTIKRAWVSGYYHAGYTFDLAYAHMKADEYIRDIGLLTQKEPT